MSEQKTITVTSPLLPDLKEFEKIINAAKANNAAIRIGINTGSLPKSIKTNKQIIDLIKKYVNLCEKNKFYKILLSIKSSNINRTLILNI